MPQGQRTFNVVLLRVSLCLLILKKNLYIYSGFLDSLKKANYPLSFWHFLRFCVKDLRLYLVQTRIQKFFKEGGGVEEGENGAELKLLGKIACILTLLKCINVPQKKLSYNITFFVFLNSKRIATPLNPLPLPLDPPMVYEVCISSVKWNDEDFDTETEL